MQGFLGRQHLSQRRGGASAAEEPWRALFTLSTGQEAAAVAAAQQETMAPVQPAKWATRLLGLPNCAQQGTAMSHGQVEATDPRQQESVEKELEGITRARWEALSSCSRE